MIIFILISVSFLGVRKGWNILGTYLLNGRWNNHWLFSRQQLINPMAKNKAEPKYAKCNVQSSRMSTYWNLSKSATNTHRLCLPLCSWQLPISYHLQIQLACSLFLSHNPSDLLCLSAPFHPSTSTDSPRNRGILFLKSYSSLLPIFSAVLQGEELWAQIVTYTLVNE